MEQAQLAFMDEDYATADELFSAYIATHPDDATALVSRAAVHLKLNQPSQALHDAEAAASLKSDLEVAWYRQGVAAFALEDFSRAKEAFMRGRALLGDRPEPQGRRYDVWLRKTTLELGEHDEQGMTVVAEGGRKELRQEEGAKGIEATVPRSQPSPTHPPSSAPAIPAGHVKFQFYQTTSYVTVTILYKGLREEDANVSVQPRQLKVSVGADGDVLFDRALFETVVPEESTSKIFATKIEVKLRKAMEGLTWPELCALSPGAAASVHTVSAPTPDSHATALPSLAQGPATAPSSKPLRPYASTKDWGAVEKEISKELESEKPEGDEALNTLFRDIYAKGSDETRRAMVKSFQTSGGTVLSTNWEEVGKKDYEKEEERKAPEGMEWRKWGV